MKIKHLFLTAILFTISSLHTDAATISVTNTNDSGAGSLRQAIADAAPGDTINFSVTGTITLTSHWLVIDKNLTIQGPGASQLSISGNNALPVFAMYSGISTTLDGITIRDGRSQGGGGIYNGGTLTVKNSTITGNFADSSGGSVDAWGGGISNSGTLIVTNSTISGNIADHGGGGIANGGTLTVSSSTISGNTADSYGGGGIYNSGTLTVTNSTISGNTGGGISAYSNGALRNTIAAGNYGGDIDGAIQTARHNLIGDAASSGGIVNGVNGNIVGVNPMLGPLQNNGGPTMTHALRPGSPAVNAGDNCVLTANGCGNGNPALTTDQRGIPRNGSVDIGAFERQSNEPSSSARFDFDGDGRSDVSVFRPSDSIWYIDRSSAGFTAAQFGISTDKITPADYDGDGKTDISIFRDGTWWRINSGNSSVVAVQFGTAGDIPVPGDYNGDGRDELAVYRNGEWWLEGTGRTDFGIATDKPVPADYNGNGKTDISIFRDGVWWRINSENSTVSVVHFGIATDRPVVGDYDGDSKADLAVYRDGTWHILQTTGGYTAFNWGLSTDTPTPADYDGDGKTDAAVYRNGTWYLLQTTSGVLIRHFGLANDKPVASAYCD